MQNSFMLSQPDPLQQITATLQGELVGLFQVRTVTTKARGQIVSFGGRLLHEPDVTYDEIFRRFLAHGYTPMLRQEKGEDVILAFEGVVDSKTGNPLLNLVLFLATILTTLFAGATIAQPELLIGGLETAVMTDPLSFLFSIVLAGWPFALALITILGFHELGHYVAARLHGVRATLPYFIPFIGLGTLGAFIAIKSPMRNRKVLFDIGLAGPVAGFVFALPLMIIGLQLSTEIVPVWVRGQQTVHNMGSSILSDLIINLFTDLPESRTLVAHPIFFAAWIGFYLTAINLLPVGQLDGGHVTYALLGRFAHIVAIVTFIALIVAGFTLNQNWFIWALFTFISGLRHPPPLNDLSELGWPRKMIGLMTVIVFILIIIPVPTLGY